MIIRCPNCGERVVLNGLGRRPLNLNVKNVCDALRDCHDIALAAERLGCSRGYIYKVLKKQGKSPRDFIRVDGQ